MECPFCRENVEPEWEDCPACGNPFTLCESCPTPLKTHWKICPTCKATVREKPGSELPPQVKTPCEICGTENLVNQTFTCKECRRKFLCQSHLGHHNVCDLCRPKCHWCGEFGSFARKNTQCESCRKNFCTRHGQMLYHGQGETIKNLCWVCAPRCTVCGGPKYTAESIPTCSRCNLPENNDYPGGRRRRPR